MLRTSFVSFVCTFGEVNCPSGVSTETSGRYEIYGNELFMYLSDGQTVGTIEIVNGAPNGNVLFGSTTYRCQSGCD